MIWIYLLIALVVLIYFAIKFINSLLRIKLFAIRHNACNAQLNKFKEFLKSGDDLQAWQTVLGNLDWLDSCGLNFNSEFIEKKANGIGKIWYDNGQLRSEMNYQDGKLNGLCRIWDENGILTIERNYKNNFLK